MDRHLLEGVVSEVLEAEDVEQADVRQRSGRVAARYECVDLGNNPVEELGVDCLDDCIACSLRLNEVHGTGRGHWASGRQRALECCLRKYCGSIPLIFQRVPTPATY